MEIKRSKYLDWLENEKNTHFIKVLTGIRRIGKSTILKQFKQTIKQENIIAMDFNDARLVDEYTWKTLIEHVESKSKLNVTNYVLFDEIQEINDFEKTIITLFEHKKFKYDIYITGSNSKMFSSELVSLFTGRTSEIEVFPFSYNEILNGVSNNKIDFEQYLLKGGLGIIVPMYTDDIRVTSTLEKVYNGLIKKDVKNRHTIKYYDGIEKISEYLFHHVGRNVSANNLENYLKSNKEAKITKKTLLNYFRWLNEAFLFHKVNYYDVRGKKILQSKSKYYASDLGLLTIKTFDDITFNYGYRLENAVLLKLLESNYQVFTGEDRYKNEIDFVIKKGNVTKYIQVCETLDERIFERESRSLLNIKDAYEKIILTLNIGVSHTKGIKIINLQKYLKEEVSI